MLTLDLKNCLSSNINTRHGLDQNELVLSMQEHQKIKKKMLQNGEELGFLELPFQAEKNLLRIENEALEISKKFLNVIFIGIGGSALGALALIKSLKPYYKAIPSIFFADNPESEEIQMLLDTLDFKKTLLIPISKSGNTIESLAIFSIFYEKIKKAVSTKAKDHVISITEENSGTLYQISKLEGFKIYDVPKNVGGRFSVFSNVGLLPAAITGIDIRKILQGAKNAEPETAYLLAILQHLMYNKEKKMTVFFGYGKKLEGLSDWYIQLLAESIGKNELVGPTPLKAVGAIDQHSKLQLFMEGPNNKFFIFVQSLQEVKVKIPKLFEAFEPYTYLHQHDLHEILLCERKASAEALALNDRPNITITMQTTDEENMGEILFLLELQVAFLGELFNINAFNQPGVELGKKLTKQYLQ